MQKWPMGLCPKYLGHQHFTQLLDRGMEITYL